MSEGLIAYRSYGQRCVDAVLSAPGAATLPPAEIEQNEAWGKQYDEYEKSQVHGWAAEQVQRALADRERALQFADEAFGALTELQTSANERLIKPSDAVSALNEAERRLDDLRSLQKRVKDQADQATFLQEQPHQFLDDLWRRYPAMGDRATPPHWYLARRVQ